MDLRQLAIIVPTYNERDNIRKLLVLLKQQYPALRIMVADDNSPDGTAEVVREVAQKYENIELLLRDRWGGMAGAYLDAFARLLPDTSLTHIGTMDADLSHHPNDLIKLIKNAPAYDIVIGSRYVPGGRVENRAPWRRFISRYGNRYGRLVTGLPIEDLSAGLVIYRTDLLAKILPAVEPRHPYSYQMQMKYFAHRLGAQILEIPITFREHQSGKSKLKGAALLESLIYPWYLRFFR